MATNVLKLLEKRQMEPFSYRAEKQLAASVSTTRISLAQIADKERRVLRGHVVLGFTRSGRHLLSYLCQVDNRSEHTYSLHWWRFDMWTPLVQVCSKELFQGEVIKDDLLHLVVCQSADNKHVVVVARIHDDIVANDYEGRVCHVSIFPDPDHAHGHAHQSCCCCCSSESLAETFSLHFTFAVFSPFPDFTPSSSLQLPGCVLINTTDTLVAVSYSVQQEGAWPPPCEGCGLEIGPHCTFFRQVFVQDGTREVKFNDEGHTTVRLLPVDVYRYHQSLFLARSSLIQPCPAHYTPSHAPSKPDYSHLAPDQRRPENVSTPSKPDHVPEKPGRLPAEPDYTSARTYHTPMLNPDPSSRSSPDHHHSWSGPPSSSSSSSSSQYCVSGAASAERQCVVVQQSSLDIEVWLNKTLQIELKRNGLELHCLVDYEVQIAEVCEATSTVVFVVAAMGQLNTSSVYDGFTLQILACWTINTGATKLLKVSEPALQCYTLQSVCGGDHPRLTPCCQTLAARLSREHHRVPTLASQTVRSYSNHTVFSGKSLPSLPHPTLPVSLVLGGRKSRSRGQL